MPITLHPTPCLCPTHRDQREEASPGLIHKEGDLCPLSKDYPFPESSDTCRCVFYADSLYLTLLGFCGSKLAAELLYDKTAEQADDFARRLHEAARELDERRAYFPGRLRSEPREHPENNPHKRMARTEQISLDGAPGEVRHAEEWLLTVASSGFGVRAEKRSDVDG